MRTDDQELHHLYNKHELGPKMYRRLASGYNNYPALTRCPCGDWLVYSNDRGAWLPLYGHVAADFINANPEIYPEIKEYWTRLPKLPDECTIAPWEGIDYNVEGHIKAYHNKPAAIILPTNGGQDPEMVGHMLDDLPQLMPQVPSEYTQGDQGLYQSVTVITTDNTATQKPLGQGTNIAPPNIHNLWGMLGGN